MAGKYGGWQRYFSDLAAKNRRRIRLSFAELEDIIDDTLPGSAYVHAAWWSGDRPHTVWRESNWRASPDLEQEHVDFERSDGPVTAPRPAARSQRKKATGGRLGVQDLNDIRRTMRQLCDHLEAHQTREESLPGRINRLLDAGLMDRIPASLMHSLNTFRNQMEYEEVELTQTESDAASLMWQAVREWAAGKGWPGQR